MSINLDAFRFTHNNDPAQFEPYMICVKCGDKLCSIEEGDTLAVIVGCAEHTCATNSDGLLTSLGPDAFEEVRRLGYDATRNWIAAYDDPITPLEDHNSETVYEAVHGQPFSEALDAFEDYEAIILSDAIYEGIADAWHDHVTNND
jgi:hypothetical protein